MEQKIKKIMVLGLGKVGALVGTLLKETGFEVTGVALREKDGLPFPSKAMDIGKIEKLEEELLGMDAVISCMPYHLNKKIASVVCKKGIHYFDLTEDVPTTKAIIAMSKDAKSAMVPQCGLAPGFICIIGASLAEQFEKIRHIRLRVGALPQHPTGLLGYAFNWSPEGVVNEYLNDCEVLENGEKKWISPLEWLETIVINGVQLEAFTTSGGLGTMCDTYAGRAKNIDYKTIRYPGHANLMNFIFHELLMREDRQYVGNLLANAKPPVSDDVVFIHASVEGVKGSLMRDEYVRAFYPVEIAGRIYRAISWTTAASACAVIEMVSNGSLPDRGFIRQESIPLNAFLQTSNGRLYNNEPHGGDIFKRLFGN